MEKGAENRNVFRWQNTVCFLQNYEKLTHGYKQYKIVDLGNKQKTEQNIKQTILATYLHHYYLNSWLKLSFQNIKTQFL